MKDHLSRQTEKYFLLEGLLGNWASIIFQGYRLIAESSKFNSKIENRMTGNLFSYGSSMKLDENKCEL